MRSDHLAKMVDIGSKKVVKRVATAEGRLELKPSTLKSILSGTVKKGDVISASKLVGIQAAKATSAILPLCHLVPLTAVEVEIELERDSLVARCTVGADYKTGVEMEALTGVTAALLNAWDMVKYLEKDDNGQYPSTTISDIRVVRKTKGR